VDRAKPAILDVPPGRCNKRTTKVRGRMLTMKIYGFPLSPFVRKTLVSAREKGLEVELIPAMDDNGFRLADSTAIIAYLDAKYPRPVLIPAEPEARGRAIWFEEVADTVLIPAAVGIVVNRFLRPRIFGTEGDEAAAQASEEAIKPLLAYLENAVDGDWLHGEYSIGDIAVASCIRTLGYTGWAIDPAAAPRLAAWFDRVTERPAWQATAALEERIFSAAGL
jgi:glutathione S-transferase